MTVESRVNTCRNQSDALDNALLQEQMQLVMRLAKAVERGMLHVR